MHQPFAPMAALVPVHTSPKLGARPAGAADRSRLLAPPHVNDWKSPERAHRARGARDGRARALRTRWVQVVVVKWSKGPIPPGPRLRLTQEQQAARRVPWLAACHPRSKLAHLFAACGRLAWPPTPRRSQLRLRPLRPASHPTLERQSEPQNHESAPSATEPPDLPRPCRAPRAAEAPPLASHSPIHRCHRWVLPGQRSPCLRIAGETRRESACPDALRRAPY